MKAFRYQGMPNAVLFGAGTTAQAGEMLDALGIRRVLLISTPRRADRADQLRQSLGDRVAAEFAGAVMHTPIEVTDAAMDAVREHAVEGLVAFGGGSTVGLSKAIALRTDLPQLVIPTTYAGSEMTPILGQTEHGTKTTQRTMKVLPEAVIYDVNHTLTLPSDIAGPSGINAIAHAVEGLYAEDGNPMMSLIAEEGIRALASALPRIARDGADVEARTEALYGAWLCGTVLGSVGMALHHKLCHVLGGSFDLPHAETHSILLPHAVAYNAPAIPSAIKAMARALGDADPAAALFRLGRAVGAPAALRDIGMPEDGVSRATDEALRNAYRNPQPLTRDGISKLIANAWSGEVP